MNAILPPIRLQQLATRIHALGPRPLYHLLSELASGAEVTERIEEYAAIDPEVLRLLGGSQFPPVRSIEGGRDA